jgi:hypothetical protein
MELELELITRPIQPQLKAVPRRELAGPYASTGSELDSRGEGRLQGQRTDVSKARYIRTRLAVTVTYLQLNGAHFPLIKQRESARVKPDLHAGVTALWPYWLLRDSGQHPMLSLFAQVAKTHATGGETGAPALQGFM